LPCLLRFCFGPTFGAVGRRKLARGLRDASQIRRRLALAGIFAGGSLGCGAERRRRAGIVGDWVVPRSRLAVHTAAYWLMLVVREAVSGTRDLANGEFATLRLRFIKIAAACPEADLFRRLARRSVRSGLEHRGMRPVDPILSV
jgi:hypothetical protein